MTLALAVLLTIMAVVTWGFFLDHRQELDWRRPIDRAHPRTDVNQQWTVVDR